MTQPDPIYSIGHSTRTLEQFIALLRREGIRNLVDVRRFPASRRYPHFDSAPLAASLAAAGISYEHASDLGGRRTAVAGSRNVGWRNASFRGYADHMASAYPHERRGHQERQGRIPGQTGRRLVLVRPGDCAGMAD